MRAAGAVQTTKLMREHWSFVQIEDGFIFIKSLSQWHAAPLAVRQFFIVF
jgi:hypothetical protein